MRLSKLTLSGFKSFAKTTAFEFPVPASAIVGPNGSGKSNVAEAIRWVLGEQSMKTLRGKRGEDLIFNGSASHPRMGKAGVKLNFDNRDHAIPLDFDEVLIERKIFRDGTNEYYLNDSHVRLKDIIELLARMGLGETKHNIIGQGEVDHILSSSPRERRDMLEEAIGLRLYQLRKREAERKLEETGENVTQIEALLKEIAPHLKFLKTQADKSEKRETVKQELENYYRAYIHWERARLLSERERLEKETAPAAAKLKTLEKEIKRLREEIDEAAAGEGGGVLGKTRGEELEAAEVRRRELERELGRIEGRIEAGGHGPKHARAQRLEFAEVEKAFTPALQNLREALTLEDAAQIKQRVKAVLDEVESAMAKLKAGLPELSASGEAPLEAERERIQKELSALTKTLSELRESLAKELEQARSAQANLRGRFERLRGREEEASGLRSRLQRLTFEEEKLALRSQDLRRIIEESGLSEEGMKTAPPPVAALPPEELRKKIEKFKIRLEEIGGIDPAVLKEYHDTKTRSEFLERELSDLKTATRDLGELVTELEDRIESDFQKGFSKIKAEFHHYFRIIFGGGKGEMRYVPLRKAAAEGEEANGEEEGEAGVEYGIDIDVDLPRKRIKGLAMLSGGERALVSIALLFAITAVNPPPFLVLDETDAALDEANSQKYAAILKELSQKTQLILITHNRETMKQAEVLYGVTMGEDGISKILSLKLEEAEDYGNR